MVRKHPHSFKYTKSLVGGSCTFGTLASFREWVTSSFINRPLYIQRSFFSFFSVSNPSRLFTISAYLVCTLRPFFCEPTHIYIHYMQESPMELGPFPGHNFCILTEAFRSFIFTSICMVGSELAISVNHASPTPHPPLHS